MAFDLDKTLDMMLSEIGQYSVSESQVFWRRFEVQPDWLDELFYEFASHHPDSIGNQGTYTDWFNGYGRFIDEAVANAGRHGNLLDREKAVDIKAHYGANGVVYVIRDQGEGFDVRDVIATGKHSDISDGRGFELFKREVIQAFDPKSIERRDFARFTVSYNDKGNEMYLQFQFV